MEVGHCHSQIENLQPKYSVPEEKKQIDEIIRSKKTTRQTKTAPFYRLLLAARHTVTYKQLKAGLLVSY